MSLFRFLTVLCLLIIPATIIAQSPANQYLRQAREAREANQNVTAWRALIQWEEIVEDDEWEAEKAIVAEIAKILHDQAIQDLTTEREQRALELSRMLMAAESLALVERVYPDNVEDLRDTMRVVQGTALWGLGHKDMIRGQRELAENSFRQAMDYLREGDRRYPRLLYDYATLLRVRGLELLERGQAADAEVQLRSAIASYEGSQSVASDDPTLQRLAQENIDFIRMQLPALRPDGGVVVPPPPPPEPGFLDFLGEGKHAQITGFLKRLVSDPAVRDPALMWVGIAAAVVFFGWIGPNMLLSKLARRGDLSAAKMKQKSKFIGVLLLFGYIADRMKTGRDKAVRIERAGCPNCSFPLDNPMEYEDLVFGKCPKCKEPITPIYTLEGFMHQLGDGLSTEVEKVGQVATAMNKFVERESMVRLVRAIVTLAVRRRASDLHIEPDENHLVVRQRIDGIMTEMIQLPRSLALAVVSAIKVQANLNIAEKRMPQDGKMSMIIDRTEIDIRVASSPAANGEKASLRLLDVRSIQLEARHLGMSAAGQEVFNRAISAPHGLVLVAGPTGSGKTTTLYVALQIIKTSSRNIISIEDPIEFRIPGVNQIQVNTAAGLTFATGLRSILRQDPDVIMVGEIRDKETAEISVNSATTGHLVFSTLHTIDSASTVARLMDLGVGPRQFADALSLIVAQRLIRLVCRQCSEEFVPDFEVLHELGIAHNASHSSLHLRRGRGCAVCNSTGYFRRTGVFEFLLPSDRLRGAIEKEKLSTTEIRDMAVQSGMKTLRNEAIELLLSGVTTVEETLRVTK